MATPKTSGLPPQSPFYSPNPTNNNLVTSNHNQPVQSKTPDETITTMHHVNHVENSSSPTADQSKGSLNISSNELEKQEIAVLAKDIKHDTDNLSQTKPENNSEPTSDDEEKKSDQTSQSANNEEIIIDKEGNIIPNPTPKPASQN
jgi:hypothetical protein